MEIIGKDSPAAKGLPVSDSEGRPTAFELGG
jgi:hypothetical protein